MTFRPLTGYHDRTTEVVSEESIELPLTRQRKRPKDLMIGAIVHFVDELKVARWRGLECVVDCSGEDASEKERPPGLGGDRWVSDVLFS